MHAPTRCGQLNIEQKNFILLPDRGHQHGPAADRACGFRRDLRPREPQSRGAGRGPRPRADPRRDPRGGQAVRYHVSRLRSGFQHVCCVS